MYFSAIAYTHIFNEKINEANLLLINDLIIFIVEGYEELRYYID